MVAIPNVLDTFFCEHGRTQPTRPSSASRVNFAIRKLLYVADGSVFDTAAVRGILAELLLEYIHRPLDRDTVLAALGTHGVRLRNWAIEHSVIDRVAAMCEAYVTPLRPVDWRQIHGESEAQMLCLARITNR